MSNRGKYRGKYRLESDNYDDGGNRYSQHDDRTGPIKRGRGGRGRSHRGGGRSSGGGYRGNSHRSDSGYRGNRGGRYNNNRGRGQGRGSYSRYNNAQDDYNQEDEDGDVNMDGGDSKPTRFNPYARPNRRGTKNRSDSNNKPHQHQRQENWYQITIVEGEHIDEGWLHQELQTVNMIQYQPVQYHFDGRNASFFLNDRTAAEAIRNCTKKLTSPNGEKITIIMRPSIYPPLTETQITKIKEVLSRRFDATTHHLDCTSFALDQELRGERILVKLSDASHLYVVTKIIRDHISSLTSLDLSNNRIVRLQGLSQLTKYTPNLKILNLSKNLVKHVKEFEAMRHCDLSELTLDQNPMCSYYQSQAEYINDIREYFPNVLKLDGQTLPPPVKFDVENEALPVSLPNFLPAHGLEVIKNFIETYFKCFDTSRSNLSEAYHENALFTLSMPTSPRGPPLRNYFELSRNLKTIKKATLKYSTIASTQKNVIAKLEKIPKTTHHFDSFCIDVPLVTSSIVHFVVRGTFKEGGQYGNIRSFSRSFMCQVAESSLKIINEQFLIRNPVASELAEAKKSKPLPKPTPTPTPAPAPVPSGSKPPNHMQMIAAFSTESGMNLMFSEQCLAENGWNYQNAGQKFLELKEQGLIPPEAFVK
uniref:Nuclear RNA export factor 1-like n=1 Tax=Phallusia mammillata TaxID=59560 RepID=A0A6F9DM68_9ASCI|nr:nuclear RNA export factor 1-like [Phallusia mammillata]